MFVSLKKNSNFFLSHFKRIELRYSYSGDTVFLQNEISKSKHLHLSVNSLVSSLAATFLDFLIIFLKFFSEKFCFKFWWSQSICFSHDVPLEKKIVQNQERRVLAVTTATAHRQCFTIFILYVIMVFSSLFGVLLKLFQGKGEENRKAKKTGLEKSQRHTYICFFFLPFL